MSATEGIDIDLTMLSSTMVYSEVYNMMATPDDHIGKTVKVGRPLNVYHDEDDDRYYFACLITDATACCTQGLEFELAGEHKYPDDYPTPGSNVTVVGRFDVYQQDPYRIITLRDAELP